VSFLLILPLFLIIIVAAAAIHLYGGIATEKFENIISARTIRTLTCRPSKSPNEAVHRPAALRRAGGRALFAAVYAILAEVPRATADSTAPASSETAAPAANAASPTSPFGLLSGFGQGPNLFGDVGGLRPALANYGVTLAIQDQSEILGNLTGGVRQGFDYDGVITATVQMDTQKAFGWSGGLLNVSGLQSHGSNLSVGNLLVLQYVSNIEADPATRLWELWYQQKMFDDKVDIKVGQQSIDQEFALSPNSGVFLNSSMGWSELPAADMPAGGPVYPLSALGVRVRAQPTESLVLMAGAYNGSPVSDNYGDPQVRNPSGTSFPLNGGVLTIAEAQYAYPNQAAAAQPNQAGPPVGVYKIGFWYDSESFPDQRYDNAGVSLASPISDGVAALHRGDYAFYATVDQMIYRFDNDPTRNINFFVKPTFTPLQDRNLISFSVNGGLTMHEPFVGRTNDTFGVGFGYARVSNSVSALDEDKAFFNPGVYTPVRSSETFIEATYQYQAAPWWQIQPDAQYFFNPGAGVVNPTNSMQKVKNEAVIGIRSTITF
jgi:porin